MGKPKILEKLATLDSTKQKIVSGVSDTEIGYLDGVASPIQTQIGNLTDEVDNLKNSVSNGKTLVANAITAKGVTTATTAEFQTMANNIAKISMVPSGLSSQVAYSTADGQVNTDYSSSYTLLKSVTVERPIMFVVSQSQLYMPYWGLYRTASSTLSTFDPSAYTNTGNILSIYAEVLYGWSDGGLAFLHIQFSEDKKTINFYIPSNTGGSINKPSTKTEEVKIYY